MDLSAVAVVDQHAHNILRDDPVLYASAFTESADASLGQHTLFYGRSLREVAALLECEARESDVVARRKQLGTEAVARRCFQAANLAAALLDDGFLAAHTRPLEWHQQFVPTRRILRLETLAEQLLPSSSHFDHFLERYRAALDPPPPNVVALKSIAAYRSGLVVEKHGRRLVLPAFLHWQQQEDPRLCNKILVDFLLYEGMMLAAKHALPVQFHTGFGDTDLDLRLANPLHLRPLLEDPRLRHAPVVLLHASYPYTREAGYLAAVYPHVYLDCGLAIPFLSRHGMRSVVRQLLELAPTTKLLYSSDASRIPELFYLGALWGRRTLAEVLEEVVRDGDASATEAERIAAAVLADNARQLYRL